MNPSDDAFHRHVRIAFYTLVAGALIFLLGKVLFSLLLPFTAAALTALLFHPLIQKINKKTGISRRFLSVSVLLLLMCAVGFSLFFLLAGLFSQVKDFFVYLYNNADTLLSSLFDRLQSWREKLPLGGDKSPVDLSDLITRLVNGLLSVLSSRSAAAAAAFAARLPSALLSLFVFLLAVFFFSLDYDKILAYVRALCPPTIRKRAGRMYTAFFSVMKGYLKAYFLLFLITFAEVYLAFSILNVDFALVLALITAILDILPAVGVGIVLIPWALALFIMGSPGRAVALLAVYLIVTLIRQVIEPHILGVQLGLHPLVALLAAYLGFRLLGIPGLLVAPLVALAVARLPFFQRGAEASRPSCDPEADNDPGR